MSTISELDRSPTSDYLEGITSNLSNNCCCVELLWCGVVWCGASCWSSQPNLLAGTHFQCKKSITTELPSISPHWIMSATTSSHAMKLTISIQFHQHNSCLNMLNQSSILQNICCMSVQTPRSVFSILSDFKWLFCSSGYVLWCS